MDQGKQTHLMEQIQAVVGSRAVCADTYIDPFFQHLRHWRKAVPQFHIAGGIGHNTDVFVFQNFHIVLCDLYTVSRYSRHIKQPVFVCHLNGRTVIFFSDLFDLALTFREVHMDSHPVFLRFLRHNTHKAVIAGIGRMGS